MNMAIIKKEVKENFFAMKGFLWLFVVSLLFSGMTYSIVTVKELSLLAQTEVMVTMGKIIIGVGLLITLMLAAMSFSTEKEQSTIESLMLTPISGLQLAVGKLIGVLVMWWMIFLLAIPYVVVLSTGTTMLLPMIGFLLLAGTAVVFFYTTFAISLSILMGSSKNAMITSLVFFLITALPAFLSTVMKKVGFGMILERISPLSNVINLMKGVIINRQDLWSLMAYVAPLLIYILLGYIIMTAAVKRFNFEGGE